MKKEVAFLLALQVFLCSACNSGHSIKGDTVYFLTWNEAYGNVKYPIEGADAQSFQSLNRIYGKDIRFVYFETEPIKGADADSFIALDIPYGKDKNNVYFYADPISGARPDSFSPINFDWSQDKENIFNGKTKVQVCDKKSFRLRDRNFGLIDRLFHWGGVENSARDDLCLFHESSKLKKIKILSPDTFEWLKSPWSKDSRVVYFGAEIVKGADPTSFTVVNGYQAKDREHCYEELRRIPCNETR